MNTYNSIYLFTFNARLSQAKINDCLQTLLTHFYIQQYINNKYNCLINGFLCMYLFNINLDLINAVKHVDHC